MGPKWPWGLRRGIGRLATALVIGWLLVIAAGGWALVSSQNSNRSAMLERFESRARYTASFLSLGSRELLTRERAAAQSWLATPRISSATLTRTAAALGLRSAGVLDSGGRVIAGTPIAGASLGLSLSGVGGQPMIVFAVVYSTPSGQRVFSGAEAIGDTLLPTVLDHMVSTPGWRAYLIDAHGGRLTAGPGDGSGKLVEFSMRVRGTDWRLTVSDPENQLYGFLEGPQRWLAWLGLAGLGVAGLAVLVLLVGLQRRRAQLTELNRELTRLAAIDPLTGLRNRRAIDEYLTESLSAARRHELPLSLLVLDIDHFKTFNDRLGHQAGDAILAHTGRVLAGALRTEDAIGRWGGEEFLVVLPGSDEEGALAVTERLRRALADDQPEPTQSHGLLVTVTIGLAQWRHEPIDELMSRADHALYLGKAAGRNTVEVWRPDRLTAVAGPWSTPV
jgi:diguanylate cyclase (GGDEF)-like protein